MKIFNNMTLLRILFVISVLILFILPCVSTASEKPEIFVQMGYYYIIMYK